MSESVIDSMHSPTKLFKLVTHGQNLILELCCIYKIKDYTNLNCLEMVTKLCEKRFPNGHGVLFVDKIILITKELDKSYSLRLNKILK